MCMAEEWISKWWNMTHKKEQSTDTPTRWMSLKDTRLRELSQRTCIMDSFMRTVHSRQADTARRLLVAGAEGGMRRAG